MTSQNPFYDGQFLSYLSDVEGALIRRRMSTIEREQVLDDLKAQIAEMMATEDELGALPSADDVLLRLESADQYATGFTDDPQPSSFRLKLSLWVMGAAAVLAAELVLLLGAIVVASMGMSGPATASAATFLVIWTLVVLVFVPFAIKAGAAQIRNKPQRYQGSRLCLVVATIYWTALPIAGLVLLSIITRGYALYVLGVLCSGYLLLRWVSGMRTDLSRRLPPDPEESQAEIESAQTTVRDVVSSNSLGWFGRLRST